MIDFEHVTKIYKRSDKPALEDIDFHVADGEFVFLVGHSGAGKSTLLNALTGAGIPANDRLFDTLDTTTRLLTVSDTLDVVISDTVGFIRKLPHQLVEAFKATLEELEYADLLLHVIDISNPEWIAQAEVVDQLIHDLGAEGIPCIRVYNKSDLFYGDIRPHGERTVNLSARTGEGLDELLRAIDAELDKGTRRVTIHLPYDKGGWLDSLYREAKVESVEYGETIDIVAVCTPRVLGRVKDYVEGYTESKEDWERAHRRATMFPWTRGKRSSPKSARAFSATSAAWRPRPRPAPFSTKCGKNTTTRATTAGATSCTRAAWCATATTVSRRAPPVSRC
mgnify:CR=1 FL=1